MKTISSQRYLDGAIVAAKQAASDYRVSVSPVFAIDGQEYRVVLNGHHALAAAIADGAAPVYVEMDMRSDDRIALIDSSIEDFLAATYIDSAYYDIATGDQVW